MKRILFNDGWIFSNGTGSALAALLGPSQNPSKQVTLPHDAVIHTTRADHPIGNGMGFYPWENVNYVKTFQLPEDTEGKVVWLEFEGIYQNAFIYINNAYAGRCTYGYGNYFIEATRFLNVGKENTIKVVVKNGVPSGRWYTGGGIYRNVQMMVGGLLHIACKGVKISTLDIEEDQAVIRVVTPIEYSGSRTKEVVVRTELIDANGNVTAAAETPVTVFAHENKEIRQQLVVTSPALWDTEHPNLYTCHVTIEENELIADEWEDTFGIRRLQLDVRKGLRINGKPVKLRGGCIHHDNGIIGGTSFAHAEERRVRKLKEAGFNALRMSHHPAGKDLLRACDRLGMLVMDEFTDAWTTTKMDFDYGFHFDLCWEQDVENMVHKDYNHPCVVMYSIGNEIPETGNKIDSAWGKKIADKIRSLDDTRYIINCVNLMLSAMEHMDEILSSLGVNGDDSTREINSMMDNLGKMTALLMSHEVTTKATEEAFGQVDIAGYNYAASRYESDVDRFPNRIMLGSETYPPELANNWSLVEKYPQILGDFAWTAWDYLGEAGVGQITYGDEKAGFYGSYPWRAAYAGTINLIGDRRPISYLREIIWGLREEPYIAVQPPEYYGEEKHIGQWTWTDSIHSWNWSGHEGKAVIVEVFSNGEEVELFVNGTSAGRKIVGEKDAFVAEFDVNYEPGEIKAVSYKGEVETTHVLQTAKDDSHISCKCSRTTLKAGGDIAFIEIGIVDKAGILNSESCKNIHVEVQGVATLYALGSADPKSEENYWEDTCAVFEGRALAVIRSGSGKGQTTIAVTAEGCQKQTVSFEIV